jgi:hypothetical protein
MNIVLMMSMNITGHYSAEKQIAQSDTPNNPPSPPLHQMTR